MGKISKRAFIDAVKGTGGLLTQIASNLKVSRSTLYNYLDKNPDWRQLIEEEADLICDEAENALFSKIKEKDLAAVKYFLSTKGKKRGYTEKQEIEHSTGNEGVKFVIVEKDEK